MHVAGMPAPVGFQQGPRPAQNGAIVPSMNAPPMGTIPLNTVIDHIIHKTYHDIVVMADLLPGKPDMERKNDIAHFANRTRQLVIRLLAVVKWASSVGKVSKCEEITQLLDQQAMLFIDTADKLHTLANQLVVQARLPNFAIPAAVDVLTTGTYPRLPRAIRDKILPPDPITPLEKAATLKRLNQIIMYRLVTTKIPLQIMELIVDKGMVKLVVPGEFQAMLTLMGDEDEVPWRLLKLEFMVEDRETGSGRTLVHNLQVNYIHELVQSRLIANEDPIQDLYNVLHSFCLSLQLEVLQAQTVRLIQERWGRLVQIDEYLPGVKVVLSYWRLTPYKSTKQELMTVAVHQRKTEDGAWILDVTHKPPLILQNVNLVEKASKIRDLSFERLLSDTIKVRSFHKLYELQQMLQKHIKNDSTKISKDLSSLIVPLIKPCQSNENLCVSIDPQTGIYVPMLTGLEQQLLDEMEKAINESPMNLLSWIPRFRNKLARKRCKSSVQNLPAYCVDELSFANNSTHPIGQLSKDIVYIKLKNFSNFYVVVELIPNEEITTEVLYRYHLLTVSGGTSRPGDVGDMKADSLVQLETSLCCDEFADLKISDEDESGDVGSHFNSELAQVVSVSNARIPFISLIHDLAKEGILHQGLMEDGIGIGLSVKIMSFPEIPTNVLQTILSKKLVASLLECSFKLIDKSPKMSELSGTKIWIAELVFTDRPLKTESQHGFLTRVMLSFDFSSNDSPVKLFNDEWTSILKLYEPVARFSTALKDEGSVLHHIVTVHSYNYRSLVLKYGKSKHQLVTIKWSIQNDKFVLLFGRCSSTGSNSHTIASHYLVNQFNSNPDIGKLVQILHDTSQPLQAICSLSSIPLIGMASNQPGGMQQNPKSVSQSFSVIIQSPSHIRLIYRSTYALDIYSLPDKKVAIRDGSLSMFDSSKVKEGMYPIVGLKSFLSLFESPGSRKRSVKEKDDPPAPDIQSSSANSGEMRTITRGVWAGSNPVILDQDVFTGLLSSQTTTSSYTTNILEQFLGHTLIRRELEHIIRSTPPDSPYYTPSPSLVPNPSVNEPLCTFFAANSLMFRCTMQFPGNRPHLNLAVQQVPPLVMQEHGIPHENWQNDDLLILERFFKMRVATQPFRPSNIHAFCSIISSKSLILRDFINVMRLELTPHQNDPTVKWIPQICLTVPPWLSYAPAGLPAVYIKDKILIFVLMTMKNFNPANPPMNRQAHVMPIVWYLQTNIATLPAQNNPLLQRIEAHLRQYMEERRQTNTECHMFSAIKYLMDNFSPP
uniref:mediator of RNA polymerase II transcription subunit 14-like n=1 Tax=Styela clava TaxID=7725 RepID=UPI0019398D5C|nr:mediator of RNA polymerase II transcription subunit 14-like [Styela clava]